jgi:hypothetical protein
LSPTGQLHCRRTTMAKIPEIEELLELTDGDAAERAAVAMS